ncbi:hypothetical protein O209_12620 [Lactiplantibacillus plantarum WHE 92]|nr:hypothetical protein O209_12620 [Lactiplantibacillus plantarum WHE 92]
MDYHIIFIDKMQVAPPQNSWLLLTTVGPQYLTFRNQKKLSIPFDLMNDTLNSIGILILAWLQYQFLPYHSHVKI